MIDLLSIESPATYSYDPATGKSICHMQYKNEIFIGEATCHPHDTDMMSERVGCYIAEVRAAIKCTQFIKNHELRPALQALKHLESIYKTSPQCDENSKEFLMLRRQIQQVQKQLAAAQNEIALLKQNLKEYIDAKDKIYNKIRKDKKR